MPQKASVFCNFYIRVDREALVSERALDVGSVAFKPKKERDGETKEGTLSFCRKTAAASRDEDNPDTSKMETLFLSLLRRPSASCEGLPLAGPAAVEAATDSGRDEGKKAGKKGTQRIRLNGYVLGTKWRTTQLLWTGTGNFVKIPKIGAMHEKTLPRSSPSHGTFTKKEEWLWSVIETRTYRLAQKSVTSLGEGKQTLTAVDRRNIENRQKNQNKGTKMPTPSIIDENRRSRPSPGVSGDEESHQLGGTASSAGAKLKENEEKPTRKTQREGKVERINDNDKRTGR
ncbi:hypothetical protein GEV33_004258 [Tenebrio molitor]|uniref:Uncharacterized protein n=1 Tax=Tenebrio molitor TaxID=7067 RepID=A0A8J6HQM6_TENMO|nr:hypothetical protein GEV33_004258 [Tenebrio molitor]